MKNTLPLGTERCLVSLPRLPLQKTRSFVPFALRDLPQVCYAGSFESGAFSFRTGEWDGPAPNVDFNAGASRWRKNSLSWPFRAFRPLEIKQCLVTLPRLPGPECTLLLRRLPLENKSWSVPESWTRLFRVGQLFFHKQHVGRPAPSCWRCARRRPCNVRRADHQGAHGIPTSRRPPPQVITLWHHWRRPWRSSHAGRGA